MTKSIVNSLFEAISHNDYALIKNTLTKNKDIDVNSTDLQGWSLFSAAISSKNIKLIKLLINKGADVNFINSGGNSPLIYALIPSMDTDKRIEIIDILLKNGADVNYSNEFGNTPLMLTSNSKIVERLLQAGANINTQNYTRKLTALQLAVFSDNIECVQILLNHPDINIYLKNNENKTALDIAHDEKNIELINIINTYKNYIELNKNLSSDNNNFKKPSIKIKL